MNRNETLAYIRDNSRCQYVVAEVLPKGWTLEMRLTNDARSFMLLDMGNDGFQVYWSEPHNNIAATLEAFIDNSRGLVVGIVK